MRRNGLFLTLILSLVLVTAPAFAQQPSTSPATPATSDTADRDRQPSAPMPAAESKPATQVMSGQKHKMEGTVLRKEADSFIMREDHGGDVVVKFSPGVEIREKKSNPFRGAKKYTTDQLVRGLRVEVEGRGDDSGALVASKIRTGATDLMVAQTVETRVTPVEGRLGTAETRLTQSEANAQRLSGQIEELNTVSTNIRGQARTAQQTADAAVSGVNSTNERITNIDDYEARKSITVQFKVNSAKLTDEAKSMLDQIANEAKNEKGFVIEVSGFASSDGNENYNRRLSHQRADAVVQYLAENHDIPLRRIITPFGYGQAKPVADNTTRDGRQQNRRVEVKILVSKGLTTPATVQRPASSGGEGNQ